MPIQDLLRQINENRERRDLAPVSEHALAAVLMARAQFEAALAFVAETAPGADYALSVRLCGVKLPSPAPTSISYVCSVCGSASVEHAFWVDPNTEEVTEEFGTWNYDDTVHCHDCGENHSIIDPDEFRQKLPRALRRRYVDGVRLSGADLAKLDAKRGG